MKVMIPLLLFLRITTISSIQYTSLPSTPNQKYVFAYTNKTHEGGNVEFVKTFQAEDSCISKLVKHAGWLKVVVAERFEEYVKCYFFAEEPKMVDSPGSTYYIEKENYCSGVCNSLVSCGKCKCYNICSKKISLRYFCDCTKVVPVAKTCAEHFERGQLKDGKYLINPNGNNQFPVFCRMKLKFKNNNEIHCNGKSNKMFRQTSFVGSDFSSFTACYSEVLNAIKNGRHDFIGATYHTTNNKECWAGTSEDKVARHNMISCLLKLTPAPPVFIPVTSPTILMLARFDNENERLWNRPMEDYEDGFGSVETWIGLKHLHTITKNFETDLRVVIISSDYRDTVTTTYYNFFVWKKYNGYKYNYSSFASHNARDMPFNFTMDRLQSSVRKSFQECNGHRWWNACNSDLFTPTSTSKERFGFGSDKQDITGIAMFLITKQKRN